MQGFCGSTGLLLTMYGGLYALLPAFAADLFGEKHVTAIFGRLMMAAPIAAVAGPMLLSNMRAHSYSCAAIQLAENVDARHFEAKFGAPTQELNTLLGALNSSHCPVYSSATKARCMCLQPTEW